MSVGFVISRFEREEGIFREPAWTDCSGTVDMLDSQRQFQNFLLAQASRWPSNGKIRGRIERANWKSGLKLQVIFIKCLLFQGIGQRLVEYVLYLWTYLLATGCSIAGRQVFSAGVMLCFHWLVVQSQDLLFVIPFLWCESVQSLSCLTLCDPTDCSTPAFSIHHQLPEYTQTHVYCESVMPSNHLIFYRSLRLLPSLFPSIRVFSNESILRIRWPKYWSFNFSINPSSEYSGLISFRIDMLDLLADQGTLKSLLQHHSSKTSILRHSAFFTVQLSHPYMCTGKKQSFD